MSDHQILRQIIDLDTGWRFSQSDPEGAAAPAFDDRGWEVADVPHDWAIHGPFDREHDLQWTRIVADGEEQRSEHTGRTGGLPHVGVAWYRLHFDAPEAWADRHLWVEFDGVMSHSEVFLNGEPVGAWPYGYASFAFDLTDHLNIGGENVLAVRVDNKPCASRWYPGAGIYRPVRLVVTDPVHVAHWGTYVTTPEVSSDAASIRVRTAVEREDGEAELVTVEMTILDPNGEEVASAEQQATLADAYTFDRTLSVEDPVRWDVADPRLYTLIVTVKIEEVVVDRVKTPFGIRSVQFDADQGFLLNGRSLKLNGVCMHHDLGPLGAAVNRRALARQLEILRGMGCNAIRTSHNPPAPDLLNLCDTMGFLVMDEAFDEWRLGKVDNGYHTLFDDWAERDLRALIRRDRNHPSVIMWSIGNEILDQREEEGAATARWLTDLCHEEDPTRPVTAGFNNPEEAIANGLADAVDIPGWNYRPHLYARYHEAHPEWTFGMVGTETESCVSSRGFYAFPVEEERDRHRPSLQVTSYDVSAPPWGYSPDYEFAAQDACPYILGQFTWTGFDYLGEPTPYKREWPSRSSYFGIVDLCGFLKDRYYLYKSHWTPDPVLHVVPHWTWHGREGEVTPVHIYTNYDRAELFLNGRSLGIRQKNAAGGAPPRTFIGEDPAMDMIFGRYRLIWEDVKYEPGVLKVVALDADGAPVDETEVRTAGPPARVELVPDRREIDADGVDLAFVTVRILDAEGRLCPQAANRVTFEVGGAGERVATGNGDPTCVTPFDADTRDAFHGLVLLIVRAYRGQNGDITIRAASKGLTDCEITIVNRG